MKPNQPMCKCCFGNVEGESCGWPKGSIRGIIALISIPMSFTIACAAMILLIIKEQYSVALGFSNGIWGVVGTIVGYYFGTKQGESAAKLLSQAGHDIIESRNREIEQNHLLTRDFNMIRTNSRSNPKTNSRNKKSGTNSETEDDIVLDMVDL